METKQLEQELIFNERVVTHPTFGNFKLTRPTPRKERLVAEERRKAYHSDIRNPDILSRGQLEQFAITREMWSKESQNRLFELSWRIGEIIGVLDLVKYSSVEEVIKELTTIKEKLVELCLPNNENIEEVVDRMLDLEIRTVSTEDRKAVMTAATSTDVDDLMERVDIVRAQAMLLKELNPLREELYELQEKSVSLFADSLEDRAERTKNLAEIYYNANREDGSPVCVNFESMLDLDPELLRFLQQELMIFRTGIDDEKRKIMEKHNFLGFTPVAPTSATSEASPEVPNTNSDGASEEKLPEDS
jgi:hypothetical protein